MKELFLILFILFALFAVINMFFSYIIVEILNENKKNISYIDIIFSYKIFKKFIFSDECSKQKVNQYYKIYKIAHYSNFFGICVFIIFIAIIILSIYS